MKHKKEEKRINVPLTIDYYRKLVEISEYENRFVCRQAARLIKNAVDNYGKLKA